MIIERKTKIIIIFIDKNCKKIVQLNFTADIKKIAEFFC